MGRFKYIEGEKEINKLLKYNQMFSEGMQTDECIHKTRNSSDINIASTEELLKSLGYTEDVLKTKERLKNIEDISKFENRPKLKEWKELMDEVDNTELSEVSLEDILSESEIQRAFEEADEINKEFSKKTSIVNKVDLNFLSIATVLQVTKSILFPYVAEKLGYGESFDPSERMVHNDKSIENEHKKANDMFKNKYSQTHKKGYWINILYQTPPYDITKGSQAIGINMGGKYHRLYTLGHDPILGWIFGTANIFTDVITMNNFQSYRVVRKPKMHITNERIGLGRLFSESYQTVKDDYLNLPAAIFTQAQHLKSDVYTKTGLPVPLLATFNENFASNLYKNQYDALCAARDTKIVGASYMVSMLIDMLIGLIHGLFRQETESKEMYEVRTRKILLISNSIASTSSLINTMLSRDLKKLDIGSVLLTISHLFSDVRFITKIKQEFIENEINKKIQLELDEIDRMLLEF